jgi:3',5'-cyclic-AMP phosphodiesterase
LFSLKPIPLISLPFLLVSCEELFEYYPNQIRLKDDEKNLTAFNLQRLANKTTHDTLRILAMGDTLRFYDDTVDIVTF